MSTLEIDASGRLATIRLDRDTAVSSGGHADDTEGLINMPLTVPEVQAVVFFKEADPGTFRVSFRSKGAIDVGAVAAGLGGGGHKNAAGCTVAGPLGAARAQVLPLVDEAISRALDA